MEESDIEMESVFDDNIKIRRTAFKDKTNLQSKRNLHFKDSSNKENVLSIRNENQEAVINQNIENNVKEMENNSFINKDEVSIIKKDNISLCFEDVKSKYKISFDYEKDRRTDELNNKWMEEITNKLKITNENINNEIYRSNINNEINNNEIYRSNINNENINNEIYNNKYSYRKDPIYTQKLKIDNLRKEKLKNIINNKNVSNASSSIILEIQREFNDLKESHKTVLQLRNRLLVLIDKEVQIIKKELEDKKKEEIKEIEMNYKEETEKYKNEALLYKAEVENCKERFNKYKGICKEKILEYKRKIDERYRNKK